jgi:hypothetical protein
MNRIYKFSPLILLGLLVAAVAIWWPEERVSADSDIDYRVKSEANRDVQEAATVSMQSVPLEKDAQTPKPTRIIKKHSRPFDVNPDYLRQLKNAAHAEGQAIAKLDKNASAEPSRPPIEGTPCESYPAIPSTGWSPPDPHAAAGTNQLVVVVNSSIAIFSTVNGDFLYQVTAESFFAPVDPPSSFIFDPKVVYDPFEDRFIILYLCTDDIAQSSYLVAVSKTGDAMGEWWLYDFDANLNGTMPVDQWPDYPGLGFDYSEAVYITSNQWGFTSGYQYVKIRVLKKSELYAGSISGWYDFWDMRYYNNEVAFTIKPAVTRSDAGCEYLLSNIWYGADYTTFWKITDAASESPTLTRLPKVDLAAAYSIPPNPNQANTDATLIPIGPMTQDVFYRNDKLYTVFGQSYDWGSGDVSALRLIGIDVNTSEPFLDEIWGADGIHYFYPAIATDYQNKIYVVFSRSSSSEYPSIFFAADYEADNSSYPLRLSSGYYGGSSGNFRWGDYGGISIDPSDRSAWLFHEWSTASHDWNTWFGEIPGPPQNPILAYPANGSEDISGPITFDWSCATIDTFVLQIDDDPSFTSPVVTAVLEASEYTSSSLIPGYEYHWRVMAINHCGHSDFTPAWSFTACGAMHGDADGMAGIDIDDAVFLIAYIFAAGPPPDPYWMGDANCSTEIDIDDVVYLIQYIFAGGPQPCGAC